MKKILFTTMCLVCFIGNTSALNIPRKLYITTSICNDTITTQLLNEIERLNQKIKELKEQEKRYQKAKLFEQQRDSLQVRCDSLLHHHIALKEVERLRNDSISLAEAIQAKDSMNIALKQELESLKDFKAEFIAGLARGVDEKWLGCSFGEISNRVDELQIEIARYDKFKDETPEVLNAYQKLTKFHNEYNVYLEAIQILNGAYDFQKIRQLTQQTASIESNTVNSKRKEEMADLHTRLKAYVEAVDNFKYIVETINIRSKDAESVMIRLNETLADEVESVKKFPWLKKMYDQYYKQVTTKSEQDNEKNADINQVGTIAHKIYNLKTK